ncbi:MAG: response regulator [Anaerolineales bacterium]
MSENTSARGKILVVDDDPIYCSIMQELLRRQDYAVQLAYDVPMAMNILASWSPDLVLTDVMMPQMDGLTFVRSLRSDPRWAEIPAIVVSARVMRGDREAAVEAGADDFIPKPFSLQHLCNTIHSHLQVA